MKKSFLKSKTVHGLKTGNHSNPNVLRAARASGGSCMVEGASAPTRMTKAPRMMRADGGGVQISEDSKAKAKELRDNADKRMSPTKTLNDAADGLKTGIAGALISGLSRGRVGRTIGNVGMVGGPAVAGAGMIGDIAKARSERKEADSIERGEAIPGKEDKYKNGGRIMPRFNPKKGKC